MSKAPEKKPPAKPKAKPAHGRSDRILKILFAVFLLGTAGAIAGAGVVFWHFSRGLPKIITVADYHPLGVTRILGIPGKDGQESLLGEFYKERRYLVPYDKIPDVVVRAFTSAEDDKFFEHSGINILSMVRAGIANFRAGHVVQGGSTITQQVAKSLLLTPERSFVRKIKEVILASRIEHNLSKQQILYLYLNQIYLGHGAYGVQAAARTYYRKDVSQLTLAEAAVLAGMPQAPGKYSPIVNPKKAKERQLYVLRRMFENKYISQSQMTEAAAQPLKIFHDEDVNAQAAAYLVEHVRRYLIDKYGEKAVYEEGLTVNVPTSPEVTAAAARSLREGLAAVDKRIGYRGPVQHLNSPEEIEKFLRELRLKMIESKVHYQILMPDGRLDPLEAMKYAGMQTDLQLLDAGENYQAVVTSVDDRRKVAGVILGAVRAELPLERMKWARALKDDKSATPTRGPEPKLPSSVVSKGDVILVKVLEIGDQGVIVGLEQEPQVQGALLSIEAQTGYVLAMEGGYDFDASEFNRATQSQRQPGSSFKPIIYACALEGGYTPTSIIVDSPIVYEEGDQGKWKPGNFEEKFYGDTTFRQALIHSRNIPTIKIVQNLQVGKVIDFAKRLGMSGQFNNDLSMSLGSGGFSLMEMTRAYALFPRLGRKVNPIFLTRVADRDGKTLEEQKPALIPPVTIPPVAEPAPATSPGASPAPAAQTVASNGVIGRANIAMPAYPPANDPDQVLDPRVAYVMTHLMKEVVAFGTGHDAKALGRPAAGKTGTTSDYIDAWFMGFTPSVVTGVWVGFDNQRSIGPGETGAKAALPIWLGFMRDAVKKYPEEDFAVPPGIVFASIDPTTGKLAPPNSSQAIKEAFIEGTQPSETSSQSGSSGDASGDFFKDDTE